MDCSFLQELVSRYSTFRSTNIWVSFDGLRIDIFSVNDLSCIRAASGRYAIFVADDHSHPSRVVTVLVRHTQRGSSALEADSSSVFAQGGTISSARSASC